MKNLIQSVLMVIAVLQSTTGAQEVIYAQVGQTVALRLPGTNHLHQYLYWFFGNEEGLQLAWRNPFGGKGFIDASKDKTVEHWTTRLSLSDDSLVIKDIQQQHFGTYTSKVTVNGITSIHAYKVFKLDVTMNPPSPLLPGEFLTLICNAETQSHKKPQIHWLNPQRQKMLNNKLTMTAAVQHHGVWACVVTHDKKENRAEVPVTVIDFSPAPLRPQYTSKSTPLTVPCSIRADVSWEQIKAKGIQEVHWQFFPKQGSSLISDDPQRLFSLSLEDPLTWKSDQGENRRLTPVSDLKKGNLSLTRRLGREEDRGVYVCTMIFRKGVTLNRTVHVEVLQITSSPGTQLISGQQVNLSCSLGHPLSSDLRLKWLPPDQSSLSSLASDRHPAHLTIPEVGTGDSGKWRCELRQNDTRLTSAVIELKIEPRLSVWMLVIICSVTVILILLLILVLILCRRRQRKMRHLRHRLCQCKNPKPKGFYRA